MKILIISTSARRGSLTLRFSRYLQSIIVQKVGISNVELVDFENFDFPSFGNSKLNNKNLSTYQGELVDKWLRANLVIFCCPEYNWSTNAEVYTMFEHLGSEQFSNLFEGKIFSMVGVSSGRGGRMTGLEVAKMVNKLISFLGKFSIVSPKILEAHEVVNYLGVESNLLNNSSNRFEEEVKGFVKYTLKLTSRWLSGVSL